MSFCLLNILPVELFYSIFVYLPAQDIVQAFSDVCTYVDDVLHGYNLYALQLCSISRADFDLIYRLIRPNQVVSLKLSDSFGPSRLFQLFFSRFKIEQFIHLRSLNIEFIDEDIIDQLIKLPELKQLSSLILPGPIIDIRLQSVIRSLLPQLTHLVTSSPQFTPSLPNLRYLSLIHCNQFILIHFLHCVDNLRSLEIHERMFHKNSLWANSISQLIHLRRLVIKADNLISIDSIEFVVSEVPNLVHLELDLAEFVDGSSGYQWESFTYNLKTFNFRFNLLSSPFFESSPNDVLAAYKTLFWLEYKHWFVACDNNWTSRRIFTVPRFAPEGIYWPSCDRIITCTSSDICLYQSSHRLTWSLQMDIDDLILPNVTSLELIKGGNSCAQSLLSSVDFNQHLPRLNSLVLPESLLMYFPRKMVLSQIRYLVIHKDVEHGTSLFAIDVKHLSNVFHRLERLDMPVNSWHELVHLVDTLEYLSCAVFCCRFDLSVFYKIPRRKTLTRYWLIYQSRRLWNNRLFTSRIEENIIHLRLGVNEMNPSRDLLYKFMHYLQLVLETLLSMILFVLDFLFNRR